MEHIVHKEKMEIIIMDLVQNNQNEQLVTDGSESTFMEDVVEASKNQPVIVDFWAPWCGPCKTLGPALEAEINSHPGKIKMVKIDIDQNQSIAQQMRIQSIPAVFAFVDGQPVDGFQGAKTPSEIKDFVQKVISLGPNNNSEEGLESALEMAEKMLEDSEFSESLEVFLAIIDQDAKTIKAYAGVVKSYLGLGELSKAQDFIANLSGDIADKKELNSVKAQVELASQAESYGDISNLRQIVLDQPENHQAQLELAVSLFSKGNPEEAIELLLEILKNDLQWNDGSARIKLIKLLDSMNTNDSLALKGRRKLSSIIFA